MNESLYRLLNIVMAILFFAFSMNIVINTDAKMKKLLDNKKSKNYIASELSLRYKGEYQYKDKNSTKDQMLIAGLLLEKSREEEKDDFINSFGENVNLKIDSKNIKEVKTEDNIEISCVELKKLFLSKEELNVNLRFKNLDFSGITISKK